MYYLKDGSVLSEGCVKDKAEATLNYKIRAKGVGGMMVYCVDYLLCCSHLGMFSLLFIQLNMDNVFKKEAW